MHTLRSFALCTVLLAACGGTDVDGDGYPDDVDCNDHDSAVHPGAVEVCNGIDDDCDGNVDPPSAQGTSVFYADKDGDGHGDPQHIVKTCAQPAGFAPQGDDCDDDDASRWKDCD